MKLLTTAAEGAKNSRDVSTATDPARTSLIVVVTVVWYDLRAASAMAPLNWFLAVSLNESRVKAARLNVALTLTLGACIPAT